MPVRAHQPGLASATLLQGVILGVFTVIDFSLTPETAATVPPFASVVPSSTFGIFIVVTTFFFFSFTVQFARAEVMRRYWHNI